jgi:hypothetical protein
MRAAPEPPHCRGLVEELMMSVKAVGLCVIAAGLLAGCGLGSSSSQNPPPPATSNPGNEDQARAQGTHIFYHNGEKLFTDNDKPVDPVTSSSAGAFGGGGGVGVNSFLWRASLDTISFMPVASADPFGGVIITDWFTPSESPNERFKLNIFVLGKELRADGVRATVFRQKRDAAGQWADAPVDNKTGTEVENAILTRARQMRLSTASK